MKGEPDEREERTSEPGAPPREPERDPGREQDDERPGPPGGGLRPLPLFRVKRADPKNSLDFEDVADK